MNKQRKHYAPEEKVAILRQPLLEKEPVSKLCDEVGLQPTVFYRWQKEFFENGVAAFEQVGDPFVLGGIGRVLPVRKRYAVREERGPSAATQASATAGVFSPAAYDRFTKRT